MPSLVNSSVREQRRRTNVLALEVGQRVVDLGCVSLAATPVARRDAGPDSRPAQGWWRRDWDARASGHCSGDSAAVAAVTP